MDLFRLCDDENYDKICGQVLLTTKGRLAYFCTSCGQYRNYESFIGHLLENCCQLEGDDDIAEAFLQKNKNSSTAPAQSVTKICNKPTNEITFKESIESKNSTQIHDSNLEEIDANEEETLQSEYYEENCDEYINVECLEDEFIDDESQVRYEIEQNVEINDDISSQSTNQLQTEEETQDSYEPEENELTQPRTVEEETIADSVDRQKTSDTQLEVPLVVRNVRARNKYHGSHIPQEERKYKCPVCGFAFKNNHNMNLHLRRHTNMKNYKCSDCDKSFYTSTEVGLHSRVHKKPVKNFLCTMCGLAFEANYLLVNHQKRHTNQRDYICEICNKGFFLYGQLKIHMYSHSNERPYTCNICFASFKHTSGLSAHMKQHENKRQYKCKLCEAAFNVQAALNCHIKSKHKK